MAKIKVAINEVKNFWKEGGIIMALFTAVILIGVIYKASDNKYPVQHQTHYQDGIDRVSIENSPASVFQDEVSRGGWIMIVIGTIFFLGIWYLLYLHISPKSKLDLKKPNLWVLLSAVVAFFFIIVFPGFFGKEVDHKVIPAQEYEAHKSAGTIPDIFNLP